MTQNLLLELRKSADAPRARLRAGPGTPSPGDRPPRHDNAGGGADGGLPETQEILVVFVDRADCPWLRLLRPGFRHCFAALRQDGRWLLVDPLKRRLEIRLLPPTAAGFDLGAFYLAQGHRVLRASPPAVPPGWSGGLAPRPLTCVEAIKRLVGLESAWTLTPWQLFRRLQRDPLSPFVELR